ncbi:MAG: hypothetical protein M3T49_09420 [Candidatus Eremiobacteraeota bacterium]|nr:hypothetical protein [Candidatus Eremiobacteraeota bacterium]
MDGVISRRIDDVQYARGIVLATEWAAREDESFVGKGIHERSVRIPLRLAAHRNGPIPGGASLANYNKISQRLRGVRHVVSLAVMRQAFLLCEL